MRASLHDQLLHAKVVASLPNKKEGVQRPIITAIPSVVASSPRFKHQTSDGQSSTQPPTSSTPLDPSLVSNDIAMEDASGSFDDLMEFSEEERILDNVLQEDDQSVERFFSRSITDAPPTISTSSLTNEVSDFPAAFEINSEMSNQQIPFSQEEIWHPEAIQQPDVRTLTVHAPKTIVSSLRHDHSLEKQPLMNKAEPALDSLPLVVAESQQQKQMNVLRTKPSPPRLARQDFPMELQREMHQTTRVDSDALRGVRMSRTKSPTTWPKPGQASGSFSGTPGKLPLTQRPVDLIFTFC